MSCEKWWWQTPSPPDGTAMARAGYGLPAFGGAFAGTPNAGFALSDSARDWRLGWRLTLDATRRESAAGGARPEHGVMLRGVLHW